MGSTSIEHNENVPDVESIKKKWRKREVVKLETLGNRIEAIDFSPFSVTHTHTHTKSIVNAISKRKLKAKGIIDLFDIKIQLKF